MFLTRWLRQTYADNDELRPADRWRQVKVSHQQLLLPDSNNNETAVRCSTNIFFKKKYFNENFHFGSAGSWWRGILNSPRPTKVFLRPFAVTCTNFGPLAALVSLSFLPKKQLNNVGLPSVNVGPVTPIAFRSVSMDPIWLQLSEKFHRNSTGLNYEF